MNVFESLPRDEEEAFIAQCRRQLARPLALREKFGFAPSRRRERINRAFRSLAEYRLWQQAHYPAHFGYGTEP